MAENARSMTKGERTRATILRHAADNFRRKGYDSTTIASIAQEVGVSEGTVFQHFGSKSGLLGAVMDEFYADLYGTAVDIAHSPGDAEERFRALIDAWALKAERYWDLIRVFVQRSRYGADAELNERFMEHNRRYTRLHLDLIVEMQQQGIIADAEIPPTLIRDIVFGAIEHVALGQDLAPRMEIRHQAKQIIEVLLAGAPAQQTGTGEQLDRIESKLDAVLGGKGS